MIETVSVPLLVIVTCRAALVVPTVCVLKASVVTLRTMLGVAAAAAVPVSVMLGFVAALDCNVKVAARVPAANGVKAAPIVQVAPGLTVTVAPEHVPVAENSDAFVPPFAMPVIVSAAPPVFVSVIDPGVEIELVTASCVEPNVSVVPESDIAAPLAAAGLTMYAAMSAACCDETVYGAFARNFISLTLLMAFKIAVALVPFLIFLMPNAGSGPWQVLEPQLSGDPLVLR
ncbi:MAG TPA: hypothetical protein PLE54_05355 [Burkholderiaceae bacterium]|nr:hypothetical protein [Burkholderiaceae bacterium]HQR70009.1 hypothetical protein [Burkholderiaceae bacterium]